MARPAATGVNPHSPAIDQKEKLIAATERLLCSQGLGCVTTRDIARAAKVAEGALYHHFGDKAELILSVVMHERSMGPGRTTSVIAAYLRAEQQLGRVLPAAVPETVADLMLAVSFNTALRDHFFHGGSGGEAKAHRQLREAVRALVVGLGPERKGKHARDKR